MCPAWYIIQGRLGEGTGALHHWEGWGWSRAGLLGALAPASCGQGTHRPRQGQEPYPPVSRFPT